MIRILRLCIACSAFASAVAPAYAQISFTTAIGLALKSNPKVLMAQADVDKALAAVQQLRDAYIPSVVGGSGVGPPSYGFPLGQPSIFNITSQSLVFSYSQRDYLRAARAALDAARAADLILVPCQPSIMDLRAMRKTTDLLKHIKKPTYAVLNGVSVQGSAALGTEKAIAAEFKIEICPIRMGDRVAYSRCLISGHSAQEYEPEGKAAREAHKFHKWVSGLVGLSTKKVAA